jgi:hypothetical protein
MPLPSTDVIAKYLLPIVVAQISRSSVLRIQSQNAFKKFVIDDFNRLMVDYNMQ